MNLADALFRLTPSPTLLLLIVGIIALVESLALVGLLVPGVVLMTAAASLAGHQEIAIGPLLLAALVGAVAGDGLSFWLGQAQRERITAWWPLSRHPEWVARGARFFYRYGTLSVFLGRFVGPVRPIVPLIAGMLRMSPQRFYLANLASAVVWAPAYVLPGYLLGRTWQRFLDLPEGGERWLILLGMLMVGLAVAFSWLRQQADRSGRLYRLAIGLARRHPVMRRLWLAHSERSGGEIPLASWLLLVFALGALSGWTLAVLHQDAPRVLDQGTRALMAALAWPGLERLALGLERLGDPMGGLALVLPWAGWLLARRRLDALLHLGAGLAGVAALAGLAKALVGRVPREGTELLTGSLTYPSMYASIAVVVAGLAAAFIARELPAGRGHLVYGAAILAAGLVILSRLVLGTDWGSDLVGGSLLGLVVCALVQLSWQWRPRPVLAPCPWPWLAMASLALVALRMAWLPSV
jgi:membrane protein DedA with SNARE-associated domain